MRNAEGVKVMMTRQRGGGKDPVGEARCTEQLDVDYQIPLCCDYAVGKVESQALCGFAFSCCAHAIVCTVTAMQSR